MEGSLLNIGVSSFKLLCEKGYIRGLKDNLEALKRDIDTLKAIQRDMKKEVRRQESQHRQRLETVNLWLHRVTETSEEFEELDKKSPAQLKKLFGYDLFSKNVFSSYKYGKEVFSLLEKVRTLISEGNDFEKVAKPAPKHRVEERPTSPTIGHEEILKQACNSLMEKEVNIMGLHGMGGVGKTTLFNKIRNWLAAKTHGFDFVIWVEVSQGATVSNLQHQIGKKLHLCNEEWENKDEGDKANIIRNVLRRKIFVLMLDDIWEKVDLEVIGVPNPTRKNGCKVAFTTRFLDVCGQMGAHQNSIQVNCLGSREAWKLFEQKVGCEILKSDSRIWEHAEMIPAKCNGLPLALNVIGETMASKTNVEEWIYASHVLSESATRFPDIPDKKFPILMYSYDSLRNEDIKSCFLYCALFPKAERMLKESLIEYWRCEGFISQCEDIRKAKYEGHNIVCTLIKANLLIEKTTKTVVMHDVLRDMALWIASDFKKEKENIVVRESENLCEVPKLKDWGAVRRMSLMNNKIERITSHFRCSKLRTLFLTNNKLKSLSGEFIESMQKLVVLDLSYNRDFSTIPYRISMLVSLQFINLSYTSIK